MRPGRPKKYGRSSRAITVTLPEDVLQRLRAIDADVGRAIVTLVERGTPVRPRPIGVADTASFGREAVIVVTPARALKRLSGVRLVPTGNGRALIALEPSRSIPQLELAIRDAIDSREIDPRERQVLEGIAGILRRARLSRDVALEARTIIVLKAGRRRRSR